MWGLRSRTETEGLRSETCTNPQPVLGWLPDLDDEFTFAGPGFLIYKTGQWDILVFQRAVLRVKQHSS